MFLTSALEADVEEDRSLSFSPSHKPPFRRVGLKGGKGRGGRGGEGRGGERGKDVTIYPPP